MLFYKLIQEKNDHGSENVVMNWLKRHFAKIDCMQENSTSRPIKLATCGDLNTDLCSKYHGEFWIDDAGISLLRDKVVTKVNDSHHPKNQWCHVECWGISLLSLLSSPATMSIR